MLNTIRIRPTTDYKKWELYIYYYVYSTHEFTDIIIPLIHDGETIDKI